ncbi:molybdenum cofactor guanylyltransferase [bacterium]|nr:MAG: molybdenum cofactor guanylyltransferase [bacterium]
MIEAALLTGGKSRRMGRDKAAIPLGGETQGERIVRLLSENGIPTTVLGKEPVRGASFLADDATIRSPLEALRRFEPTADLVLVLSCDLPLFDPRLAPVLEEHIVDADAAVPFVDGFRQPLVGLYRRTAFAAIPEATCPMDWLDRLKVSYIDEDGLRRAGVDPNATRGANTPQELAALIGDAS